MPTSILVVLLLLLPLVSFVSTTSASDPEGLALLAFKSIADLDSRLRFSTITSNNSNTIASSSYHCRWQGVWCSAEGKVTKLILESVGLRGVLAGRQKTISLLDQLRILSLKNNSLAGPIPDLSPLSNLKALFLDHNNFVGSFPPSLLALHRIRTIDFSNNNLSGPIPVALISLDRLYSLRLERNRFNGSVPALNQSSMKIFNVSTNELSGPVPVTRALLCFDESAFAGNPGLCGEAVGKECQYGYFFKNGSFSNSSSSSSPARAMPESGGQQMQGFLVPNVAVEAKGKRKKAIVFIGFAGIVILAIGSVGLLIAMKKKRRKRRGILSPQKGTAAAADAMEQFGVNDNFHVNFDSFNCGSNCEMVAAGVVAEKKVKNLGKSGCLVFCAGEASVYTLEQLMRASAELLGRGSVGTTYKAVLDSQLIVSVKRLDAMKMGMTGKEAFEQHMDMVGRLRHPNLVPLRAFFHAKEERLLVYDYQPNGSLFSLIHGSRSTRAKPLHWTSCLKIAEDVAQGLAYIHQASRLVHGNLKSSNVLLGSDFEACITDNCLAFLIEPSEGEEDSEYMAPEIKNSNRHLTPKSDIYAFGILLLELLTGKPPLQNPFLVATDLHVWVRSVREDEGGDDDKLMMLIDIANACVRSLPESRPTTWQVMKMIQEVRESDTEGNSLE